VPYEASIEERSDETGDELLELEAPDKGGTDDETTPEAFKEAPEIPWARRFKGTSMVLMSLMVLGAIDGVEYFGS
jgi:hypothetical protein